MPDISKIEVLDGTTYDIKDAIARASIPASHPYILQSDVDYFDDVSDLPASPSTGQVAFVKGTVAFPGGGGSGIAIQDTEPSGDELVWIDTDDSSAFHTIPEVDDTSVSSSDTWSSRKILNMIYPVGCYYYSSDPTSPATLFGIGTWEQIKDTFLLAAGDTYAAATTGGEAAHQLSVNEMPSHQHAVRSTKDPSMIHAMWAYTISPQNGNYEPGATNWAATNSNMGIYPAETDYRGGGQAHNNMPPYLVAYVWHRTA